MDCHSFGDRELPASKYRQAFHELLSMIWYLMVLFDPLSAMTRLNKNPPKPTAQVLPSGKKMV
jgi:hypothetical protein